MSVTDLIPRKRNRDNTSKEVVASDELTGLSLVREERDPPRFHLRLGKRSDLVSIGDVSSALATYTVQVERLRALRLRAQQSRAPDRAAEVTGLIQQASLADDPVRAH